MKYFQAVNIGRELLPVKTRYTKRDVDNVLLVSLFNPNLFNGTASVNQAKFVVKCFALEIEADYSKYVRTIEN